MKDLKPESSCITSAMPVSKVLALAAILERFVNHCGRVYVTLVTGKSRVTPLKRMTIPRLELTAATLAVRIDRRLKSELQAQLQPSIFWTDSQSVLKYISNQTRISHTFVANRPTVIHDLLDVTQ